MPKVTWSCIKLNYFESNTLLKEKKSKEHIRQSFFHYSKLEHNTSEAKRKICQAINNWFERFRNGDFSIEVEQRS